MEQQVARTEEGEALDRAAEIAERFLANIESVVHGKREEIKLVLAALACGGHVLFEDVPGTAKTVLARAIAGSIEGAVGSRIQCTPDLQPTDATGLSVYNQKTRDFEFRRGPLFANVVLVDEINRAMPKTQSALLEAMAERQVTIDGQTLVLPLPFLVLATENPIEFEGVFPLPEAQLDRFFLKARSSCASGSGNTPSNSMGFSVARTRNGSGRTRVWPSIVTWRSAIASSSADCVFGIARLISSTRTTFAKSGPRRNSKSRSFGL